MKIDWVDDEDDGSMSARLSDGRLAFIGFDINDAVIARVGGEDHNDIFVEIDCDVSSQFTFAIAQEMIERLLELEHK